MKGAPRQANPLAFLLLAVLLFGGALCFQTPAEIVVGLRRIITGPARLLTDYMALAGIGAALANAGLILVITVCIVHFSRATMNGAVMAAIFTVTGFGLFGKNIYNMIPLTLGVALHAKFRGEPFRNFILPALYVSGLGPLISEITFGFGLPLYTGIPLAWAAGLLVGFALPALSVTSLAFHQGFNLYNTGFATGLIGMAALATLRMFDISVEATPILYKEREWKLLALYLVLCAVLILLGIILRHKNILPEIFTPESRSLPQNLRQYRLLLRTSGRIPSDYYVDFGLPITLFNMGVMGLLGVAYVYLVGGQINGPVLGALLCVIGFGAYGEHPVNAFSVLLGVVLAKVLNIYEISSTVSLINTLFGLGLAPLAGHYGPFAGLLAGFVHIALVNNIGYLHGGVNLYNNGFSAGFTAALLFPVLEVIRIRCRQKHAARYPHDPGEAPEA